MGSACIAIKNGQGAFLTVEKRAGRNLNCRKMGMAHFKQPKNKQGAAPTWKCLGETLETTVPQVSLIQLYAQLLRILTESIKWKQNVSVAYDSLYEKSACHCLKSNENKFINLKHFTQWLLKPIAFQFFQDFYLHYFY